MFGYILDDRIASVLQIGCEYKFILRYILYNISLNSQLCVLFHHINPCTSRGWIKTMMIIDYSG